MPPSATAVPSRQAARWPIIVGRECHRAKSHDPDRDEGQIAERAEHQRQEQEQRLHRHRHVAVPHVFAVDEQGDHLVERQDMQPGDPRDLRSRQQPRHAIGGAEVGDKAWPELHQQRADAERVEH
jgi:hypothetical protein